MDSILIVLLLKVATMGLARSDAWDLAHFSVLLYRNGDQSTKRRKAVKLLDGKLIMNVEIQNLWAPIGDLQMFTTAILGLTDAVAETMNPSIWRAPENIAAHTHIVPL